ncbi:hypothetical protein RDI58_015511 [Solanum bulbocastanum]|uniref:DUF1985 domain-containing protein n=1 Tax=Solanum bulbocastanum TaxID=147425 RepID=A0AAN8YCX8_SOLBU
MDDAPSTNRIYDYKDIGWAENRSKILHDPLLMANVKDGKKKKDGVSSSKTQVPKTPKKRGQKFAPAISRPSLPKGQISKCLLLLEINQDNSNELHIRHANENILRFTIKEFAIITGLKCTENPNDFQYPNSSKSSLIQKYFPDLVKSNSVSKGQLVQRFLQGNWHNT